MSTGSGYYPKVSKWQEDIRKTYGNKRNRRDKKRIEGVLYSVYPKGITPPRVAPKPARRRKTAINKQDVSKHTLRFRESIKVPMMLRPVRMFKQTVELSQKGKAIFWRMEKTKAFSIFPRQFTIAVLRELQRIHGNPKQARFGSAA